MLTPVAAITRRRESFIINELDDELANTRRDTITFAVGTEQAGSELWNIVAPRNKRDIYVSSRTSAKLMKLSLHESGRWRIGFTTESGRAVEQTGDRPLLKWLRPSDIAPGITHALSIYVLNSDLQAAIPALTERELRSVVWVAPDKDADVTEVCIILVDQRLRKSGEWPGRDASDYPTRLVGSIMRKAGEDVFVVARNYHVDAGLADNIAELRKFTITTEKPDGPLGRMVGFCLGRDRRNYFVDIAITEQSIRRLPVGS